MKKIVCLILLVSFGAFAQNSFEKANQLYQKGQYEAAIANYELILNNKQQSADLYFNLGNCYYKLNQVAPAIYNYEKALLLNPEDPAILTNLKFAQKRAIDEVKVLPKVGFKKLIHDLTGSFHFDTWAAITVGFSFLILLLFLGYYTNRSSRYKRIFFVAMAVALMLLILSFIAALFEKNTFDNEKPAIVFAKSCNLKSEPKIGSSTTVELHEGTKVFVIETLGFWRKVQLTDDTEGWINQNDIKELK